MKCQIVFGVTTSTFAIHLLTTACHATKFVLVARLATRSLQRNVVQEHMARQAAVLPYEHQGAEQCTRQVASRINCHKQLEAQARAQVVTCSVSISKIGSTEIALLMQGKDISATILDYMINIKASKDNLLDSESKVQITHIRNSRLG